MRRTKLGLTMLCVLAAMSCGKSEARKLSEVRSCSAITMDAAGAANCLVLQYRWKKDQALTAAPRLPHQQDSTPPGPPPSRREAGAPPHPKKNKKNATPAPGGPTPRPLCACSAA